MKWLRITNVHTVDIYLKSGQTIRKTFHRFKFNITATGCESYSYFVAGNEGKVSIALSEIVGVNHVSTRRTIKWREKSFD